MKEVSALIFLVVLRLTLSASNVKDVDGSTRINKANLEAMREIMATLHDSGRSDVPIQTEFTSVDDLVHMFDDDIDKLQALKKRFNALRDEWLKKQPEETDDAEAMKRQIEAGRIIEELLNRFDPENDPELELKKLQQYLLGLSLDLQEFGKTPPVDEVKILKPTMDHTQKFLDVIEEELEDLERLTVPVEDDEDEEYDEVPEVPVVQNGMVPPSEKEFFGAEKPFDFDRSGSKRKQDKEQFDGPTRVPGSEKSMEEIEGLEEVEVDDRNISSNHTKIHPQLGPNETYRNEDFKPTVLPEVKPTVKHEDSEDLTEVEGKEERKVNVEDFVHFKELPLDPETLPDSEALDNVQVVSTEEDDEDKSYTAIGTYFIIGGVLLSSFCGVGLMLYLNWYKKRPTRRLSSHVEMPTGLQPHPRSCGEYHQMEDITLTPRNRRTRQAMERGAGRRAR